MGSSPALYDVKLLVTNAGVPFHFILRPETLHPIGERLAVRDYPRDSWGDIDESGEQGAAYLRLGFTGSSTQQFERLDVGTASSSDAPNTVSMDAHLIPGGSTLQTLSLRFNDVDFSQVGDDLGGIAGVARLSGTLRLDLEEGINDEL